MKYVYFLLILMTFFSMSACSLEEKDIGYIREKHENYNVTTYPYKGDITFTLSTDMLLNEQKTPIKITSIHNTDIVVSEILERENTLNGDIEIILSVGLDGNYHTPEGKMVSLFHLDTEASTYTSVDLNLKSYDENGSEINFGSGQGDNTGRYEQLISYMLKKKDLEKSKEWTFQISGLNILEYEELKN